MSQNVQRRILKSGKWNSASRSCRGLRPQKLILGRAASPHVASLGFGDTRLNEAGWGQPALPKFKLQAAPTGAEDFKNQRSVGPQSLGAMAAAERGPTEDQGFGGMGRLASWCSNRRVCRTRVE